MGAESTSAAKATETAAPTVTAAPAGGPGGPVAFVHGLQRSIGNHALSKLAAGNRIQRQDPPGGGMSSNKGASTPGSPGPLTSEPTPAQKDARARIDEAKKQFKEDAFFAQSAMKAIEPGDWGVATDEEKIYLLDHASLANYAGANDERAMEICWASFGDRFDAVAAAHEVVWERCIYKGADPEKIPQTKGRLAELKWAALKKANENLDANRKVVHDEMDQWGLTPPPELSRDPTAKPGPRTSVDSKAVSPRIQQRLKDQQELAKIVLRHQKRLKELAGRKVGKGADPFNPSQPPPEDFEFIPGVSTWSMVKEPWDATNRAISMILNAWPVLYAAASRDRLEELAFPEPTDVEQEMNKDSKSVKGLKTTQDLLEDTLRSISATSRKLADDDNAYLALTPVHRLMWAGSVVSAAGRGFPKGVMGPVMRDEKKFNSDVEGAANFAIDVALFVALVAGVVGTMGGAAIAIGIAGAKALNAQGEASAMGAALGSSVSDAGALVTPEQVTAAKATAQDKLIDALTVVVMEAQGGLIHAVSVKPPGTAPSGLSGRHTSASGALAAEEGQQGMRLRAAQEGGPALSPSVKATSALAQEVSGVVKSWKDVPAFKRPSELEPLINKTLKSKGVPPVRVIRGKGNSFDQKTWTIELDEAFFADEIDQKVFDEMVHSLYHEGDHADLYFQVARAKANDFGSADELAKAMFMTEGEAPKVASQAFANKMEKTAPQFSEMKAHWENIYGKGGTDRARVINEMLESDRELTGLNAEATELHQKAMDSKATPAERAQANKDYQLKRGDVKQEQAKHDRNYALYENLSEETRAFTTEHKRAEWMKAAGSASEKRTRALQELERARADLAAAQGSGGAQAAIDSANQRIAISQELADLATTDLAEAHRVMSEEVAPATVRIPPKP
jgi:hypothetical protein